VKPPGPAGQRAVGKPRRVVGRLLTPTATSRPNSIDRFPNVTCPSLGTRPVLLAGTTLTACLGRLPPIPPCHTRPSTAVGRVDAGRRPEEGRPEVE
jgi:hypothetical protein